MVRNTVEKMSACGSVQTRHQQRKLKDPMFLEKVKLSQRERYRRLVADPVTRKQEHDKRRCYRIRYIAKKRWQKLKEQGIVNDGASNVKDEGMLQDLKWKNALECSFEPTVDGDSVTSHHSHETSDDSCLSNAEDEMEYERGENLNFQDKLPCKSHDGNKNDRNQNDDHLKVGTSEWVKRFERDPFSCFYGHHYVPRYFKNPKTKVTEEETEEYWPVTSVEWMDRYIDDPDFDLMHKERYTPKYMKRLTDRIYIYAPDFVIEVKRRAMLQQKILSKIPEYLHPHAITAVKDYVKRWLKHQKEFVTFM